MLMSGSTPRVGLAVPEVEVGESPCGCCSGGADRSCGLVPVEDIVACVGVWPALEALEDGFGDGWIFF